MKLDVQKIEYSNAYNQILIGEMKIDNSNNLIFTGSEGIGWRGNLVVLKISDGETSVNKNFYPTEYSLSQNYPNPFNPSTIIEFAIPTSGNVTLKVYNSIGERSCRISKFGYECWLSFS